MRPFGLWTDLGRGANALRRARVTVPLTPTLSLGERGNPSLPLRETKRGVYPTNLSNNRNCCRLFPLPVGEGQVRGIGIEPPFNTATRTSSETAASFAGKARGGGANTYSLSAARREVFPDLLA